MHLGPQSFGDLVDRRQRLRELRLDVPLAPQPFVVDLAGAAGEAAITEVRERRIVELNDIDAGFRNRLRLNGENLRQVAQKRVKCRVGGRAVVWMPVANRNQK